MELRLLTVDDAEAFWHLRLEMLRNDPESFADSDEEHLKTTIETARERLSKNDPKSNFVVGMFEHGQMIGTAGFFRRPNYKERHKGHIWGVYVKGDYRGKGLGKALMAELLLRVRSQTGLEQVNLGVSTDQLAAKKLYESLGFEVYGHERQSLKIGEEYVDKDLMVLWIG